MCVCTCVCICAQVVLLVSFHLRFFVAPRCNPLPGCAGMRFPNIFIRCWLGEKRASCVLTRFTCLIPPLSAQPAAASIPGLAFQSNAGKCSCSSVHFIQFYSYSRLMVDFFLWISGWYSRGWHTDYNLSVFHRVKCYMGFFDRVNLSVWHCGWKPVHRPVSSVFAFSSDSTQPTGATEISKSQIYYRWGGLDPNSLFQVVSFNYS